jgi:hypothetical protein
LPVTAVATLEDEKRLVDMIEAGVRVLLDSGVYIITQEHARRHNVSMDVALALAPDQIDGFEDLWSAFTRVVGRYGDQLWGYVELDQGGAANKRVTRGRLEDLGLNPMPVYHPLNDGWDYFDELAERYDRICWGNIVQAEPTTRLRFLATVDERRRAHGGLQWVHALGLTPSEWCNAYGIDSADSTTWLSVLRWGGTDERAQLARLASLPAGYGYQLGDTDPGSTRSDRQALALVRVGTIAAQRAWRHWRAQLAQLGPDATMPAPKGGHLG